MNQIQNIIKFNKTFYIINQIKNLINFYKLLINYLTL